MQLAEIRVLASFLRQCIQAKTQAPTPHATEANMTMLNPALVALAAQSPMLTPSPSPVSDHAGTVFADALATRLATRLSGHWHPESPSKGSAYRSLSIVDGRPDALLHDAAHDAAVNNFSAFFPSNITFWIDPGHVSFRVTDGGAVVDIWGQDSSAAHLLQQQPHFFAANRPRSHSVAIRQPKSTAKLTSPPAPVLPPSPPHLSRQQLRQLKIQQKQSELQEMARSLSNQYSNLYNQQFPNLSSSAASSPSLLPSSPSPAMSPGAMSMIMASSPPQSPPQFMAAQLTVSSYASSAFTSSGSSPSSSPSPSASPMIQPHIEYMYEYHSNSNESLQQYSQQQSYFYNQQQQQQLQHLNQQGHRQFTRKSSNGNNKKQNGRTTAAITPSGAHTQSWRHNNSAGNAVSRSGGKKSTNGAPGHAFNGHSVTPATM
ncbi:Protein btg1 [Chytriomyces hyalinus]|nr:Protein btg1 [Chytriomyces hyalinus]